MAAVKSLLILDDEQEALDLLSHLLGPYLPARMLCTKFPTQAIQLAKKHCFDMILLDVTFSYNGSQFGGLEIYKALLDRYGDSSLVVYSQYINDELLQRYGLPFNFVEKLPNVMNWIPLLAESISDLRKKQSCFVAMPFGGRFESLYQVLRECIEAAGYRCVRIDEQVFTDSIVERIFDEIRKAKVLLFVATGANANVFYEAGYAAALGKEIVTVTERFDVLPFDIRDRKAIQYGDDPDRLRKSLTAMLSSLTELTV